MNNVYNEPEYGKIIQKLKKDMLLLRTKYNETDDDTPHIQKIIDKFWNDSEETKKETIKISNKALSEFKNHRSKKGRKKKKKKKKNNN